ncbi:TonB-dependent receptor [Gammaproteobacteria bacterium]|nr:TonB-dependent receptor [Gammaproteobacteria bacterium]RZO95157.1 MAG: TonB-dependent receptor [Gammaproteobacteria bacterium]|tara:strand:+ start:473 stop:3415 length:2943 start_codon:yes stop_codon:yes gene_type:complete
MKNFLLIILGSLTLLASFSLFAEEEVEEVVVVGSQIKGAKITGALPVSVVSGIDIEATGVDSGEDLLEHIAEQGQNYFTEAEDASGGVNASRGDVGAYNLRNLGVGNTLTLLNGRRLVNSPGYQTELIGGDYVPTVSVNSNLIPVTGIERLEILRDGASAVYGADAVAGVINNVLQDDYEGLSITARVSGYDHFGAEDTKITAKWGSFFNDGNTNVSIFFDHYDRENINAQEDPRWGAGDHRPFVDDDSPWKTSTSFRNLSSNSLYGQFDMVSSSEHSGESYNHLWTDSNGEFEVFPLGDAKCTNRGHPLFDTGYGTCIAQDGNGALRSNFWGPTDVRSELVRTNVVMFINHEMQNGMESFTEFAYYESDSDRTAHASYAFSSSKHRVGPDNYYLNQLKVDVDGVPTAIFAGKNLYIDNYRYEERQRLVNVKKETYRFLQGFRGTRGEWDWETAFVTSKATSDDVTSNRMSNNLLKEALYDSTAAAYNPFSAGVNSNIERTLIDVYRKGESELTMVDFKISNPNVWGDIGLLLGMEYRDEEISDDRDPRLDGTITYTDYEGDTYPLVADVLNSSPTADVYGSRDVMSIFMEMQIPVTDKINMQTALRHEDFSDYGDSTVGKIALGWEVTPWMDFRASVSSAFRAPNIVQVNEKTVVRSGTRYDRAAFQVNAVQDVQNVIDSDSRYTIQRMATGAENLEAEESDNSSFGFVLSPTDDLIITVDTWSIEKDKTIGLFGRENQTVNDMLLRFSNGTNNCSTFAGDPLVVREAPDEGDAAGFAAAGVCPFGDIKYIKNEYTNMAKRTVEGTDVGIYYNIESNYGDFDVRYIGTFLDKFEQKASGEFARLQAEKDAGVIPESIPLKGFGDLLEKDGIYDNKHTVRFTWDKGPYRVSLSGLKKGSFVQTSLGTKNGVPYLIPSMTTLNLTMSYDFELGNHDARVRFAVKNLEDERAPTADRYYGYYADAHQDYGRNYWVDFTLRMK